MKKYFSNIFALAALLMAGAAFTACSSDDNSIEQPANPAGEKTYTLTVNASKGANASTRALALNGAKLVASWAEGDELSVFKAENRTGCTAGNLLGTISPVAGSISADGAKATFTGTLTGTVSNGDKLMLVYHPAAFAITGFEGQAGTLASASNLDCATALVTASVSGSDITISETSATFTTHTAMLKLTLTTDGTTTINPTALKMSMSAGSLTLKEFSFAPTAATYTANGNGVLYFALPSAADVAAGLSTTTDALSVVTITYTATVGSDTYTATKPGYTFAAGTYYAGTLTMEQAYAANQYNEGSWYGTKVVFTKQTAASVTAVANSDAAVTWGDGWYTVSGNVTIGGNVTLTADTYLILQDGAKLTINGELNPGNYNLYIYGQSEGTGKLNIINSDDAIFSKKSFEIHGGEITAVSTSRAIVTGILNVYSGKLTATSDGGTGIQFSSSFDVYGGEVESNATSSDWPSVGIRSASGTSNQILTVYGGKVTATGNGIEESDMYGSGIGCHVKSGTSGIKFYFSDNGTTWGDGTSYASATKVGSDAATKKRYAKAE